MVFNLIEHSFERPGVHNFTLVRGLDGSKVAESFVGVVGGGVYRARFEGTVDIPQGVPLQFSGSSSEVNTIIRDHMNYIAEELFNAERGDSSLFYGSDD